MQAVPQPAIWFTLQLHIKDSLPLPTRVLCMVWAGNYGLGNFYKNVKSAWYNECPYCKASGTKVKFRESHVIFVCQTATRQWTSLGLSTYRNNAVRSGMFSTQGILRLYLGGNGAVQDGKRKGSACHFDSLVADSLCIVPGTKLLWLW